eukprot:307212-Pyramimonas_sp.AAC.1
MGLRKGDRLEPSDTLADVAQFSTAALPIEIVFWRERFEVAGSSKRRLDAVLKRNPLFEMQGCSPER